jgi:hypothetical protein
MATVTEMTAEDMLQLSKTLARKLSKIDFNIQPEHITDCRLFSSSTDLGYTEVLGVNKFRLNINKKLGKENKTDFRLNVLYHELAHIIQYNEAFAFGAIRFNQQFKNTEAVSGFERLADNIIYYDNGHTMLWRDIVKDLHTKVNLVLPIVPYANKHLIQKMLEELFMREAKNYINEEGYFTHVDYAIGGLTVADIDKYSDKVPTRIEDLREALAKIDLADVKPITPPGYKGPNATKYYIQKYIDKFEENKENHDG